MILEKNIQRDFFEWLSYYPDIRPYVFAIPNGGTRHKIEARNLKLQGVTAGVPDVFVAIPKLPCHGMFIEFKSNKGKLTDSQKNMINLLSKQNYLCKICYSFEEGRNAVESYLGSKNIYALSQAVS